MEYGFNKFLNLLHFVPDYHRQKSDTINLHFKLQLLIQGGNKIDRIILMSCLVVPVINKVTEQDTKPEAISWNGMIGYSKKAIHNKCFMTLKNRIGLDQLIKLNKSKKMDPMASRIAESTGRTLTASTVATIWMVRIYLEKLQDVT